MAEPKADVALMIGAPKPEAGPSDMPPADDMPPDAKTAAIKAFFSAGNKGDWASAADAFEEIIMNAGADDEEAEGEAPMDDEEAEGEAPF